MGGRQLGACALIGRRGRAQGEHVAGGGHVVGPGGGPGVPGPGEALPFPGSPGCPGRALRHLGARRGTLPEHAFALGFGSGLAPALSLP